MTNRRGAPWRAGGGARVLALALAGCAGQEAAPASPGPPELPPSAAALAASGAVLRSLPHLEGGARAFASQPACASCHIRAMPAITLAVAREHGFVVDADLARAHVGRIYGRALQTVASGARPTQEGAWSDAETGVPSVQVALALASFAQNQVPSDDNTDKMAAFLATLQEGDGRWLGGAGAAGGGSDFAATAFAVRALGAFQPTLRAREFTARIGRARAWLVGARTTTTEDAAFRLLGLRWAGATAADVRHAADALLAEQRADGGWGRAPGAAPAAARAALGAKSALDPNERGEPPSDTTATGQALVALAQAAGMPVTHAIYRRGARFLVASQAPDGSWAGGRTPRTLPQCQLASHASLPASSWATMALALMVTRAEPWER